MKVEVLGNREGRLCVFNCLDTERGRVIYEEMIGWLSGLYCVHVVWHGGSRYEYDGLLYLQQIVEKTGKPCLYLHTKGACNFPYWSDLIRRMWRCEFGDEARARRYFEVVDTERGVVACPVQDERKIPLYNGFVVNRGAMAGIEFRVSEDRYDYERMWVGRDDVDLRVMKYCGGPYKILTFLKVEYDLCWNGKDCGEKVLQRELVDGVSCPRTYWVGVAGKVVGGVAFETPWGDGGYVVTTSQRGVIENIERSRAFRYGRVKRIL